MPKGIGYPGSKPARKALAKSKMSRRSNPKPKATNKGNKAGGTR
jgi:hypothetical protein